MLKGSKEGHVVVGGNGFDKESNQLHCPIDLWFDGEENLYIVNLGNDRVQNI